MDTKIKNIYRSSPLDFLKAAIMPLAFTGVIAIMILSGLHQTEQSSSAEGMRILEESIRRAVVMNYAIEGRYPESIEYIEEKYGIHIDKSRYSIHYSVIASNIMPDIIVTELVLA